ncbi:MAG TPA: HAD-IIA family hydrolase [Acidimicrobiia bacterium]|nr:HAD-IIA family hydrolase [Acidimicrobiia bacterium]
MTSDRPVVCCDLDGVVWRGDEPIPGAGAAISELRKAGFRVVFVSNNSSQPLQEVVAKLGVAGAPASTEDVITSAVSAATLLASALDPDAPVLACAGPGVVEALEDAGLRPVTRPPATAVVVGLHRGFDFDELDRASAAVRAGARFVATNLDATYPVPGGMIPGSGAIAAAVATAAGRAPEVAGKPERPMADLIRKRFGSRGVVVGDRPSTDGALAVALDWPFALVLSGVTQRDARPGGEAIPEPPPPFVAADLAALVPNLVEATTAG